MLADKARSKTADSKTEANSTILTLSPGHNDDKYKVNRTKFSKTFFQTNFSFLTAMLYFQNKSNQIQI